MPQWLRSYWTHRPWQHSRSTTARWESVRIRLFADQKVSAITLESELPLQVGGRPGSKWMTITLNKGALVVRGLPWTSTNSVIRIRAQKNAGIQMAVKGLAPRYTTGDLWISRKAGRLQILNVLDLEQYAAGVVGPELGINDNLPVDALKAQLIITRSYRMSVHDRHPGQGYEFCDSPHCQVYRGVHGHDAGLEVAAELTRGEYLSYNNRPAAAFFHHSCGGETASAQDVWRDVRVGYLRHVVDGQPAAYCRFGHRASWTVTRDIAWIRKAMIRAGHLRTDEPLQWIRVTQRDSSGRARAVVLEGSRNHTITGADFRSAINRMAGKETIFSTVITVKVLGSRVVIRGRGWGHGVGLCQEGAIEMAREGMTYREVLSHYYPGTTLVTPER